VGASLPWHELCTAHHSAWTRFSRRLGSRSVLYRAFPPQASFSSQGKPWTLAKSFRHSCPYAVPFEVASSAQLQELTLVLQVLKGELAGMCRLL